MRHLISALVLVGFAHPAAAQAPSRDWRPSDRTIIGDFTRITTVATALDRVYATSPTSLLIWHPQLQQWEGPFDPPDAELLTRVFASLVDPLDNSLWLARPDGWIHFQPELQLWDRGVVSGVVAIAFDATDPVAGLYLRTRSEWLLVPHGGLAASPSRAPGRPVTPASVDDVLRSSPTLQANAAQILVGPRLGVVRYTSVARGFENQGWYLGTSGVGLLYLQDGAAVPDRLAFGLPSAVVGAVFDAADGVWAASDRTTQADAALTFVDPELKQFRSLRGLPASGVPFNQSRHLVGQEKSLWVATDLGLARVGATDGRIDLVDQARGLPDSRVYAVASRQGRITVGTGRGVARVNDSLRVERIAPLFGETARAVFPAGDSVWVGTSRGMLLALPGARDLVRPAALATASLQVPVVALASLADTIVALTRDQLLWRDPRTGAWTLAPNLSALLGGLRSFTAAGEGFWVAGEHGIGFARLSTPAIVTVREGDLPGISNDLAVDREYLWVATDGGLARFRLSAIRP